MVGEECIAIAEGARRSRYRVRAAVPVLFENLDDRFRSFIIETAVSVFLSMNFDLCSHADVHGKFEACGVTALA